MRTYVAAAWISSRTNGGGVITGKVAMQAVAAARRIGQGREGERGGVVASIIRLIIITNPWHEKHPMHVPPNVHMSPIIRVCLTVPS
jgi:hypothetical protein